MLSLLRAKFPISGMRESPGKSPFAVFPAIHPEVGDIEISDDGDELTVVVGKFTHSHFDSHEQGISDGERAERICRSVLQFLDDLLADRIEMFGTHLRGGGTRLRADEGRGIFSKIFFGRRTYVWSGPTSNDA
jgi:hypothetical protein